MRRVLGLIMFCALLGGVMPGVAVAAQMPADPDAEDDPTQERRQGRTAQGAGRADQHVAQLQSAIDGITAGAENWRVLEAGCGSRTRIRYDSRQHLVGIDISALQLERNPDLDERIVGDVQYYPLAAASFNAITCWNVLEHLDHPELALANYANALKPGGLMVLVLPNVMSVKGLVTKLTPYRFHVWAYRTLLGRRGAGRMEDGGPFPTTLRLAISPAGLRRFAEDHDLVVEYASTREARPQAALRKRLHLEGRAWRITKRIVHAATFGRVEAERTELILVLRRPPN
jgi:SAM-dependent methyltransferase